MRMVTREYWELALKKHQVNRVLGKSAKKRHRRTTKRASALGIGITAALALTGAPGMGATTIQSVQTEPQLEQMVAVAYVEPVTVGLQSGVDAINWESLDFTSQNLVQGLSSGAEKLEGAQNIQGAPVLAPGSTSGLESIFIAQPPSAPMNANMGAPGALPGNLRLIHPVTSRHITSPYGWRNNPTGSGTQVHIGQDYAITCGSPVYATEDGTVIQSAWAGHSGMRVTIDHGNSVRTGYSHNSKLIAKVGDVVKQGQLIALSGTTGNSTGCHVHFEVIINGKWNDPRNFLPVIPGQPNPFINSRNTTITAEPIRNFGTPRADAQGVYDLELVLPDKPNKRTDTAQTSDDSPKSEHTTKPQPTPAKHSDKPKPSVQKPEKEAPAKSHEAKPVKPATPKPEKDHKPSPPAPSTEQKPSPKPSPTPVPKPSTKPTQESKPAPAPPAQTTPVKESESAPAPKPEASEEAKDSKTTVSVPKTEQSTIEEAAGAASEQSASNPVEKSSANQSATSKGKTSVGTNLKTSASDAKLAADSPTQSAAIQSLEVEQEAAPAKAVETKKVATTAQAEQPVALVEQATEPAVKQDGADAVEPKDEESTNGETK